MVGESSSDMYVGMLDARNNPTDSITVISIGVSSIANFRFSFAPSMNSSKMFILFLAPIMNTIKAIIGSAYIENLVIYIYVLLTRYYNVFLAILLLLIESFLLSLCTGFNLLHIFVMNITSIRFKSDDINTAGKIIMGFSL